MAGLMGNLCAESGLDPCNLQGSYEKKLDMSDDEYTRAVDSGEYQNFVNDKAGYGLAQWTYHTRKEALLEFARVRHASIGDLDMQLEFLWRELGRYSAVLKVLIAAESVKEASDAVVLKYERPANQSEDNLAKRASYGERYFKKYAKEKAMGYDPQKVIDVAFGEVGYLEKKSNSKLDDKTANAGDKNYTKYARDLDEMGFYNGKKNGFAWCDMFVDWCFITAYGLDAAQELTCQRIGKNNCGAGCKYSRRYYKDKGQLFDEPKPGDQIFFWPKDEIGGPAVAHTGLVYDVDDKYVYTVEGNTSGANGVVANGGGVCKKKYRLTYNRIAGYGRPRYSTEAEKPSENSKWTKTLTVTGGKVNIRSGNGKEFKALGTARKGDKFEWVAAAANGWHAIVAGDSVAWISDKHAEVNEP